VESTNIIDLFVKTMHVTESQTPATHSMYNMKFLTGSSVGCVDTRQCLIWQNSSCCAMEHSLTQLWILCLTQLWYI